MMPKIKNILSNFKKDIKYKLKIKDCSIFKT